MIKAYLIRLIGCNIVLTGVFSCLFAVSASAQTTNSTTQIGPGATAPAAASARGIGPAPANSKQHEILTGALSPKTRQTLQDAMNSVATTDTPPAAPPK